MFDFFKKDATSKTKDVKALRDLILRFIKERLQQLQGGEGSNIKGVNLYVACREDDRHVYESALYYDEENRFRNEEVQRIADDFAIALPERIVMYSK